MKKTVTLCCLCLLFCCSKAHQKKDHQLIEVKKTDRPPTLDGKATEPIWDKVPWHAIDQNWLGRAYDHNDFDGRFKLVWDSDALYLLVQIVDDVLYDRNEDPLKLYWDDDCLELFLDEDNSGGLHQFDYNAFAYHLALDGKVVDLAPDKTPHLYDGHIISTRHTEDRLSTWEMAVHVYGSDYIDGGSNKTIKLTKGKRMGFIIAYCDNDGSMERENLIGSVFIPGEDKNLAWIDADFFGTLELED